MKCDLKLGDCLEVLAQVDPGSVDMVFADLPYGTTYAKWDSVINMERLWPLLARATKPGSAMVFTAVQPFTTALIASRPDWFRVSWVWDKVNAANFANANRHPMKTHEDVLVFGVKPTVFYPIKTFGSANHAQGSRGRSRKAETNAIDPSRAKDDGSGLKFPKSIQTFAKHSSQLGSHPTQKPVDMVSYFIETYSSQGELVLDPTMGSGTTGVAAISSGRRFIGVEKDEKYFRIAKDRIESAILEKEIEDLL